MGTWTVGEWRHADRKPRDGHAAVEGDKRRIYSQSRDGAYEVYFCKVCGKQLARSLSLDLGAL